VATDAVHDALIERVLQRLGSWRTGDARAVGVDMGPVVDATQLAQDEDYLAVARSEGAEVLGGERVDGTAEGFYLAPALALGTSIDDRINREEVFGPVVSVVRVPDYAAALEAANASTMNLSAGICTTDLAESAHFRRHSKAGMVMVNLPTAGVDFHVPFGGRGDSSHGPREQGTAAVEFFTTSKTSYTAASAPG
jgi:aldehyde dehydrogenase (NAD+)